MRSKKVEKWNRIRAKLKERFYAMGITACEMCGRTDFLSFAHRLKRRFITTDEELEVVILACVPYHEKIEYSGHENMYKAVTEIINNRKDYGLED